MAVNNYVAYGPEVEQKQENEEEDIQYIVDYMTQSNTEVFDKHRHAVRDAHAKSHGFLKGILTIPENLPDHLAQGIFAHPGYYDVMVRLSAAPGDLRSDKTPVPHGFALKILNVPGERLLPEDSSEGKNQDFLMVNMPVLVFGTVRKYMQMLPFMTEVERAPELVMRGLRGVMRGVDHLVSRAGFPGSATIKGLARSQHHILGETYHSMAALRYGNYIAKISVAPESESVKQLTGIPMQIQEDSGIRDLVQDFFKRNTADYVIRAQLCTNLDRMPVEDAAVLWDEDESPHQVIGTLHFPKQQTFSPARRVYSDDVLSFNPWHGVKEHQPLGSIMRVRMQVYERSSCFRHYMNTQPRTEPNHIDDMPD
ncbi:catalase family protein [Acinetobacter sp. C_4_1]|uniref:catalase family protein n=1 Tax=unclassified Acinetobacter TaxID=196816 RepID=UPI0021B72912|nr:MULTISPECIES: catalase family protein [unclassified Acinetobacter]MCT8090418.1 catalase family protein [Acinetobacter sp. F_3_1]MCT8098823.1 catalase family protein [Acinetobacter sp. C_3_1]MCT8102042.1 catalase family protein [Acinetobacter sp. C_4_1]MCT8135789.1 catalase family protein [Acinetobacter sp. T_3_1]